MKSKDLYQKKPRMETMMQCVIWACLFFIQKRHIIRNLRESQT